ncbi:MAG: hypothetical protein PF961_22880 [Planctomycetota bacterium]|jgi:hypothetical protein|nr:hypothetical protein [Planctomycetota bacterium]
MKVITVVLLCLTALAVPALDQGAALPELNTVTWVNGAAPALDRRPTLVLLFSTTSPGSKDTLIAAGKVARRHHSQMLALSADAVDGLKRFIDPIGIEVYFPVGAVSPELHAALSAGLRGLPHCFLITTAGTVHWQGHPQMAEKALSSYQP